VATHAVVRIKLNNKGMRELLKSAEVRAHLTDRMQRVLSAAQAGAGEGIDYHLMQGTTDRARVSVGSVSHPAPYLRKLTPATWRGPWTAPDDAPLVVFPDVELWATGYLRAALAARPEPYAPGLRQQHRAHHPPAPHGGGPP
jgi:hypothetical protein